MGERVSLVRSMCWESVRQSYKISCDMCEVGVFLSVYSGRYPFILQTLGLN